jgi:hypothetical protein
MSKRKKKQSANQTAEVPPGTEVINARVPTELAERIRNAIWWIGRGLSVSRLLAEASLEIAERLEREHNQGKAFPQRESELPHAKRKDS